MTETQLRARILSLAKRLGNQRLAAEVIGVSPGYLNEVITGKRPPGPRVLRYFGVVKREASYTRTTTEPAE